MARGEAPDAGARGDGAARVLPRPAAAAPPRLFFERYEYKYWVTPEIAARVVAFAAPYVEPDVQGASAHQRNTSLYLDTPDLGFYRAHVEGQPDRLKLRVRRYGTPAAGPAFFELKRKVKSVIVKKRATVPAAHVDDVLAGRAGLPPLARDADRRNLEAFLYEQIVHRAEPRFLVTCVREAYRSRDAALDVRLTVDSEIAYRRARGAAFDGDEAGWTPIGGEREHGATGRRVMLELKFSGVAPAWMDEAAQALGLERGAYSKYVAAVNADAGAALRADALGRAATGGA
jgi:hypothetical protein